MDKELLMVAGPFLPKLKASVCWNFDIGKTAASVCRPRYVCDVMFGLQYDCYCVSC